MQNHYEVIQSHPSFELTCIIEKSEDVRNKAIKELNVPLVLESINQLPKDYVPDIAVICTRIKI